MAKHQLKILSLDGGGIRGIIPCVILQSIEERTRKNLSEIFDLMAGTSTGGIISLGLSCPDAGDPRKNAFDATAMLNLYKKHANDIFGKRESKGFFNRIASVIPGVGTLMQTPYSISGLEGLLKDKFGDSKLNQALTNVLITSYDLESGQGFYFLSRLAKEHPDTENFMMRDAARCTSAAPTYFVPKRIPIKDYGDVVLVDGGVMANNPSILAYSEAKEIWYDRQKSGGTPSTSVAGIGEKGIGDHIDVEAKDNDAPFFMLSIGTGTHHKAIKGQDMGTAKDWLQPLLTDIFMGSVAENTHFTMRNLLPDYTDGTPRYYRLNLDLPIENINMDDVSDKNIAALEAHARAYVKQPEIASLLDEICEQL